MIIWFTKRWSTKPWKHDHILLQAWSLRLWKDDQKALETMIMIFVHVIHRTARFCNFSGSKIRAFSYSFPLGTMIKMIKFVWSKRSFDDNFSKCIKYSLITLCYVYFAFISKITGRMIMRWEVVTIDDVISSFRGFIAYICLNPPVCLHSTVNKPSFYMLPCTWPTWSYFRKFDHLVFHFDFYVSNLFTLIMLSLIGSLLEEWSRVTLDHSSGYFIAELF